MRTLVVLMALACAALFGYWVWSSDGGAVEWEALEREARADEAVPDSGELAVPVGRSNAAAMPEAATDTSAETQRTALVDEAALVVRVVRRDNDSPLIAKGVYLDFGQALMQTIEGYDIRETSVGRVGVGVTTDLDGKARFRVPVGRELRAFARLDDTAPSAGEVFEPQSDTSMTISALASGEERRVTLYVTPERRAWHLQVVERETGFPVEGATVASEEEWKKLEALAAASPGSVVSIEPPPRFQHTDHDGRATVRVERHDHNATTIHAPGFGPVWVPNATRREAEDAPFVVRLDRGATIRGQVLGLMAPERAVASVFVNSAHVVQPPDEMYFSGGGEFRVGPLDAAGQFELVELPPDVPLELKFAIEEDEATTLQADLLQLQAGELYEHVWDLRKLGGVAGRVVDANGAPASGVSVWLVSGAEPTSYNPYMVPLQRERSDSEGHFAFQGLTAGDYLVGIGKQEQTDFAQRGTALAVPVEIVQDVATPDVELVLHRGVYLRGRVLQPNGDPAENVHVFVTKSGAPSTNTTTSADGKFELGPLLAGEHRLECFVLFQIQGVSAPPGITVEAPASGLEIRLLVGGRLDGTIVDARTGEEVRGKTSIQQAFGAHKIATAVQGGHSAFDYEALAAGTYHLIAETNDGRVGILRDVRLETGETLTGLEIPVHEAGSVRCRYAGSRASVHLRVRVDDLVLASETARPGSLLECRAPLGRVVVEATSGDWATPPEQREVYAQRVVEVVEGEEVEVVLEE